MINRTKRSLQKKKSNVEYTLNISTYISSFRSSHWACKKFLVSILQLLCWLSITKISGSLIRSTHACKFTTNLNGSKRMQFIQCRTCQKPRTSLWTCATRHNTNWNSRVLRVGGIDSINMITRTASFFKVWNQNSLVEMLEQKKHCLIHNRRIDKLLII